MSVIYLPHKFEHLAHFKTQAKLLHLTPMFDKQRKNWFIPASSMSKQVYDKLKEIVYFSDSIVSLYEPERLQVLQPPTITVAQPSLKIPYTHSTETLAQLKEILRSHFVYSWFDPSTLSWYINPQNMTPELHKDLKALPGYNLEDPRPEVALCAAPEHFELDQGSCFELACSPSMSSTIPEFPSSA